MTTIDDESMIRNKIKTHFEVVFNFGKDIREAYIFQAEQAERGLISDVREVE